jgi:hypothetical protein
VFSIHVSVSQHLFHGRIPKTISPILKNPACEEVYSQEKDNRRENNSVLFWIVNVFTARDSSR